MAKILSNGLKLEVEEFGKPSDPSILLIMGLAAQLTRWPEAFIGSLVDKGFHVVAFDNRDIGLSEKLVSDRASSPLAVALLNTVGMAGLLAPYKLTDMAKDTAGVLDALDIESAHIIGASMGGMIGQILCAEYPGRIKSFTALMSSTNNPALPKAHPKVSWEVMTARNRARTREELIDVTLRIWTLIGTKNSGRDPVEFRQLVADSIDRNSSPSGIRRQMAAIIATRDLRDWTRRVTAPTLVIHGSDDPLVPFQNGLDIAAEIENARMEIIDGMGHDLPPRYLGEVVNHVLEHLCSAENSVDTRDSSNQAA
jgi:pimeloyl-ACP methyl ester carboxylesterase